MPRTSRSVAQRLASQRSSKKRRPSRSGAPAPAQPAEQTPAASSESSGVSVDQILDEVVPSAGGARTAAASGVAPDPNRPSAPNRSPATARRAGSVLGRTAAKPAVVRRRYAEYAEEYQHVWSDLQRVLLVAGVLVVLLVVASFFIE
jgi:hypothetical protein